MNLKTYLSSFPFIFLLLLLPFGTQAQFSNLWEDITEPTISKRGEQQIKPEKYRSLSLDLNALQQQLALSPMESPTTKRSSSVSIIFPMPDGSLQRFSVVESPIMEPGLAAKFPEIKTYLAQGIDNPYATMRFDITHKGFHGMITSPEGAVFIDPHNSADTKNYISYYKKDFLPNNPFTCEVEHNTNKAKESNPNAKILNAFSNGETLRTYRLAVAATGEYTAYHGGTVADGQAAIVTTFNRVNQIYENDLSIRMVLVSNNDQLIYTDGNTDPFNNANAGTLIGQSQAEIDSKIGNANYDIGHTVSTGGGGLASLDSPCVTGSKARGITGSGAPVGDPYDVDYVAHEVGHQFGGNHTFNGSSGNCGGNISGHAYEPGSGSTIQAYAGICAPQNLQNNSDPYFHVESLNEMLNFSTAGTGDGCAAKTPTGNTPPIASAPMAANLTIPINTPFELTGAGTDIDNDALTYCWEQYDIGPSGAPDAPTGNAPIFRSWNPTSDPVRTFPRLTDLLFNTIVYGEILPTYSRSMNFRLTLRDNRAGGGGVHCAAYAVDVDDSAGPFLVTAPNTAGIIWPAGSSQTVTWDVANTTAAPVSCANVDILLSTDGGFTYPTTLAASVTNDGTETITVPNSPSTTVRIKIICSDNIFFDISNQNLEIQVTGPDYILTATPDAADACIPNSASYSIEVNGFGGFTDDVTLSATGLPAGSTANFSPNPVIGGSGTTTMTLTTNGVTPANYTVTADGTSAIGTRSTSLGFNVLAGAPGSPSLLSPANGTIGLNTNPTFTWNTATEATSYDIEVATNLNFTTIVASTTGLTTTSHSFATALSTKTIYYWRVKAVNLCGSGDFSPPFVFETYQVNCRAISSPNTPIVISENNTPTITSTLFFPESGTIVDLNVLNLSGTHTWFNDLEFHLTSPSGTDVEIMAQSCGDQDDYDLNLDDSGQLGWICPPIGGGTYQPSNPLSSFNGENTNGNWTLTVTDNVNQDGGTLDSWEVEICYSVAPSSCSAPLTIPTVPGSYTADSECTDDLGWTHYWKTAAAAPTSATDLLLLSIRKDGTTNISPNQVTVGVTAVGGAVDLSSLPYVTNNKGWFAMNRYWDVTPTTQPGAGGVNVRYYYTTNDYEGVKTMAAPAGITVTGHKDLVFYKFATGAGVNPDPSLNHVGGTLANYQEFPGVYAAHYTDHSASFKVTSFSGGGGGAGGGNIGGALPVELLFFTGKEANGGNLLQWTTETEIENDHFVVQHSLDAVDFTNIGQVKGGGTTADPQQYDFLHRFPTASDHFYRLKQVNFDGSYDYSPVISVKSERTFAFGIHPNPVNDELGLLFQGRQEGTAKLWIYDIAGHLFGSGEQEITTGRNVVTMDVSGLSDGVYFLRVQEGQVAVTKRFIKINR